MIRIRLHKSAQEAVKKPHLMIALDHVMNEDPSFIPMYFSEALAQGNPQLEVVVVLSSHRSALGQHEEFIFTFTLKSYNRKPVVRVAIVPCS